VDRWYLCAVTQTLYDPIAVLCAWGSRQTAYQQTRVFPMASQVAAEKQVNKIVASKIKRGYRVIVASGIDLAAAAADVPAVLQLIGG
jgi:predicted DNA-binding WGR domain protein